MFNYLSNNSDKSQFKEGETFLKTAQEFRKNFPSDTVTFREEINLPAVA